MRVLAWCLAFASLVVCACRSGAPPAVVPTVQIDSMARVIRLPVQYAGSGAQVTTKLTYSAEDEDEEADGPAFVRRWAIGLARRSDPDALSIEVCVFPWPSPEGAAPLTCLHTIRARQP